MFKIPNSYKVAWLLATTRVKRSGVLSNLLIILVMTLTFLNLLVVRGILVGLPEGAIKANEEKYYADVFVSVPTNKKHMDRVPQILEAVRNLKGADSFSVRYLTSSTVLADYNARVPSDETPNQINTRILGINLQNEQKVVNISNNIKTGRFFNSGSRDEVVLGVDLSSAYGRAEAIGLENLDNVDIGDSVEITVGDVTRRVNIVGIVESKVNELDGRVIMSEELFRDLVGIESFEPSEIAIRVKDGVQPASVQRELQRSGLQKYVDIKIKSQYQPSFVTDIVDTFAILGDVIGSISLAVASITIFIIIFVNAITQRKQIGILKGIGISPFAIELSYIIQALFYVVFGAMVSLPLLYGVLVPYFIENPIDFPFSDGVIVAEYSETVVRSLLMLVTTGIAGYLPARHIVKQNTLDAILGR